MRPESLNPPQPTDLHAIAARVIDLARRATAEHLDRSGTVSTLRPPLRRVHPAHPVPRDQAHRLRLLAQGEEGCA